MHQISVIVPVYRVEKYIHRCIDSILNQTFSDFELILVDDGSPDNCGAICDEYAAKDNRIVVIHQENGGLSAARNAGIDWAFANSDSQWLTFIDSDDWVHPQYLQKLYDAAQSKNVEVSVCGFARTYGEEPEVNEAEIMPRVWSPEDFYVQRNVNAVIAWGKLYKKEAFAQIRYPVGRIHEDEFVTYRILFQCEYIAVLEAPLYFYYQNENGIMGSKWSRKRLDYFDAAMEQLEYFSKNNFLAAEKKTKMVALWKCKDYLEQMEDKKDWYELKRKLRKYIVLFRDSLGISIKTAPGIFEAAYPRFMKIYWLMIVLKNKLLGKK